MRVISGVLLNDGRKAADLMDIEKGRTHVHKSGWVHKRVPFFFFLKDPFSFFSKLLSTSVFFIFIIGSNGKVFGARMYCL